MKKKTIDRNDILLENKLTSRESEGNLSVIENPSLSTQKTN